MNALRIYVPDECGADGYPFAWHGSVKHAVREAAAHRCVRCRHPYETGKHGKGEWSPCDELCNHSEPGKVDVLRLVQEVTDKGVVVEEVVEAHWRILTVHHLTGVKADLRWWNLAALCQRCHLQIQGKVCMEQVYPHEHSAWFKPYAAGYYAATYLGEDLTREQTEERLDELLELAA